jgi:transcriptional regulator NrdR family protein
MAARKIKRPRGGASFTCPKCKSVSRVTRTKRLGKMVWRERKCLRCGHEFVTEEAYVPKLKKIA